MDREAGQATVHRASRSGTRLKQLSNQEYMYNGILLLNHFSRVRLCVTS